MTERGGYDRDMILAQLPAVVEKYRRRFARLDESVRNSRTLFVRDGIDCAGLSQEASLPSLEDLARGLTALWPGADIEVLAVAAETPVCGINLDNRIALDWLGPPTGEMWRNDQFVALFQRRELGLRRRG